MKRYEDSYVHTCVGCRSYAVVTSLFQVHNETINVWTHLLGAVVFVALIVHLGLRVFPTHYTSHVPCAGEMLMRGGVHTGHLLDVALFPPAGTYQTNCVRRCTPVPTLGWMREQLVAQSGASGPTGAMAGLGAGVLSRVETLEHRLVQLSVRTTRVCSHVFRLAHPACGRTGGPESRAASHQRGCAPQATFHYVRCHGTVARSASSPGPCAGAGSWSGLLLPRWYRSPARPQLAG